MIFRYYPRIHFYTHFCPLPFFISRTFSFFQKKSTITEIFRFANDYTRDVQLQTKMDIYCPQYESAADEDVRTFSKSHHFQTIYLVDENSYKNCNLDMRKAKKVNKYKFRDKKETTKI